MHFLSLSLLLFFLPLSRFPSKFTLALIHFYPCMAELFLRKIIFFLKIYNFCIVIRLRNRTPDRSMNTIVGVLLLLLLVFVMGAKIDSKMHAYISIFHRRFIGMARLHFTPLHFTSHRIVLHNLSS